MDNFSLVRHSITPGGEWGIEEEGGKRRREGIGDYSRMQGGWWHAMK